MEGGQLPEPELGLQAWGMGAEEGKKELPVYRWEGTGCHLD